MTRKTIEQRLQELEDRAAIQQIVCGYGYAIDGCNAEAVGSFYAEDGVYAVADRQSWVGRQQVMGIAAGEGHRGLVAGGVAHFSTPPYIVLDGDRAAATCHTAVLRHTEAGFEVFRLSASRLQLSRTEEGVWQIDHRQNYLLQGDPEGPAMLARLKEGPTPA
jgi:ketosteroid isomerase-like protein